MTACQLSWLLWSLLLFGGVYGGVGSVADEAYVTADGEMGAAAYLENGLDLTGEDLGIRQYIDNSMLYELHGSLQRAREYIATHPSYRDECKNNHESCVIWTAMGECERNPRFMNLTCPPMCQACDSLVTDSRCRRDPNGVDAWGPGGAYRMFERILVEHAQYDVRVVSRPYYATGDTAETAMYQLGPWIVTLENFLSDEEADHMVALGEMEGYVNTAYRTEEQEADEDFMNGLQRTAGVVYCQSQNCYYDPIHQRILERMSNLTFLPKANHEFFQMIRYKEGQCHVGEGGGTSFDYLNLTVQPKKGRAVIFSCVLNEDPNTRDDLMDHEALKVIKGTKYAFNTHAHQRDYQTPYSLGCGT